MQVMRNDGSRRGAEKVAGMMNDTGMRSVEETCGDKIAAARRWRQAETMTSCCGVLCCFGSWRAGVETQLSVAKWIYLCGFTLTAVATWLLRWGAAVAAAAEE